MRISDWSSTCALPIFDELEDLGYAQWTDGSITLALLGAPSVYNIKRQGMWDIVPTQFGTTLLEYYTWVVTAGYPSMKPAISDGKKLLIALADTTDTSRAFRRHVISASSTYYGDGEKDRKRTRLNSSH